jgi:uroporphyrinogen-III synthase
MRVLVTRPAEDATETARQLRLMGHEALVAPLLTTRFFDGPEISLDGVQAILATSANGVRALARRTPRRDVPVFAVGPQTASEAQKFEFEQVRNADGDAAVLALTTRRWASPEKGALLHVGGGGNDGKLMQSLEGFTLRQEILYAVTPAEALPAAAAAALRMGEIGAALFYSPRSAAAFRHAVQAEKLSLEEVIAVCISQAAATALEPLVFREVRIAALPNQPSLLKLL